MLSKRIARKSVPGVGATRYKLEPSNLRILLQPGCWIVHTTPNNLFYYKVVEAGSEFIIIEFDKLVKRRHKKSCVQSDLPLIDRNLPNGECHA